MCVTNEKVHKAIEECRQKVIKLTGKQVSLVLFGYSEHAAFSFKEIADAVCKTLNVPYERTIIRSRKRELVLARQLIFFYARNYTSMSHGKVAENLGYMDHTTSIHSIKTVKELIEANDSIILSSMANINQLLNITT